jgi:hypothetical protein
MTGAIAYAGSMNCHRSLSRGASILIMALAVTLNANPTLAAQGAAEPGTTGALKAAFLFNIVKFAEWPALPARAPLVACLVGDTAVFDALVKVGRGHSVNGHLLDVVQPQEGASWSGCQLLYVADAEVGRSAATLATLETLPVLTASDRKGFSRENGIVEFTFDAGILRLAINREAAVRAGVIISTRLLQLATIVRTGHVQ